MSEAQTFTQRLLEAVKPVGSGARLSASSSRAGAVDAVQGTSSPLQTVPTPDGEGNIITRRLFLFDVDNFDDETTYFGEEPLPL